MRMYLHRSVLYKTRAANQQARWKSSQIHCHRSFLKCPQKLELFSFMLRQSIVLVHLVLFKIQVGTLNKQSILYCVAWEKTRRSFNYYTSNLFQNFFPPVSFLFEIMPPGQIHYFLELEVALSFYSTQNLHKNIFPT